MLHYRKLLYQNRLPNDVTFMGETVPLDLVRYNTDEDAAAFYRGVETRIPVGLDLTSEFVSHFPPPIMKVVETLAHPDYPMGVVTESLLFRVNDSVWMPYFAKIFRLSCKPFYAAFLPAIAHIAKLISGIDTMYLEPTVLRGLWTACGMANNDAALEGISYFEKHVPIAKSVLRVWSSERDMVNQISSAVETLAKARDFLSPTIIEGATSNLFIPATALPLVYRSRFPIYNRFIETDRINERSFYMGGDSPVKIAEVTATDHYSHRYRTLFYAIDSLPITDLDISVWLHISGKLSGIKVLWAIDRNIAITGMSITHELLEGHIRYLCEVLSDCITKPYLGKGNVFCEPENDLLTLHDVYGSSSLRICFVKSHDELIQIRIYDEGGTLVFSMLIPSAVVKLTDTFVSPDVAVY